MVDVAIIGAGPVGIACAVAAKRGGLTSCVIDKGSIVNSLIGYPTQMEFFSTPDLIEVGDHPFPTSRYKPTREEALDYYSGVAARENLNCSLYNPIEDIFGNVGQFEVSGQRENIFARRVIVATGFFDVPVLMDVPGEDLPKVIHYYKEPYSFFGQRVAVVGAKNSAAKAALDCHRHHADVTLIIRGDDLSQSVKYWLRPDLQNRIQRGEIKAHFGSVVTEISPDSITIADRGGSQTDLPNDFVLAMTGYRPDFEMLETWGLTFADDEARTPIFDAGSFETEREGVYIAGTVCGGLHTSRWFIENGREHAAVIAQHIKQTL